MSPVLRLSLAPAPEVGSASHTQILTAPGDPVEQPSWVGSGYQGPCRWDPQSLKVSLPPLSFQQPLSDFESQLTSEGQ